MFMGTTGGSRFTQYHPFLPPGDLESTLSGRQISAVGADYGVTITVEVTVETYSLNFCNEEPQVIEQWETWKTLEI
jgi:hypothetical protein